MTKIEPRLLKGFRDYGLHEQSVRQEMLSKIQTVFEQFGFLPLSTPVLEYKEILMGKYGDDEKLVYSFKDNGDRDVAMRYDLTVPLARYVAQNQGELSFPFKRYQIAPVWRADNPQKGRLREFYQCDIDVVGTDSPIADAEAIASMCNCYEAVGISDYEVRINDRRLFQVFSLLAGQSDADVTQIIRSIDKVRKIGKEKVLEELADRKINEVGLGVVSRWLDLSEGKNTMDEIAAMTPQLTEVIGSLKQLISFLMTQGVTAEKIVFDPWLARGADYYTGTIVEVFWKSQLQLGSIGGGGRYDNLVDQFTKLNLPSVGMSVGFDRFFETFMEVHTREEGSKVKALILNMDGKFADSYIKLASEIRAQGVNVELYYSAAKLDKQFKYAESKHIPYAIIMGEAEIANNTAQLKNLASRTQEELAQTMVIKQLLQE